MAAVSASSDLSLLLHKFQKLNCPHLDSDDVSNSNVLLRLERIFKSRGTYRLKMMQWLLSKLGVMVKEDKNVEPYSTLLNAAMKHGICSKRNSSSSEFYDLLVGDAPVNKQILFLSLLLDLALDLEESDQTNYSLEHLVNDLGMSCDEQHLFAANNSLDLPDEFKADMKTHLSSEFSIEELKHKNKVLEEELKAKQAQLSSSNNTEVPTQEQFSRLRSLLDGLEKFSARFLKAYDDRLAVWCRDDVGSNCCSPSDSHLLVPWLESTNVRLCKLAQLHADMRIIDTFSTHCVPQREAGIAGVKDELNSECLHATFGPGDAEAIDEISSQIQQAMNITSPPVEGNGHESESVLCEPSSKNLTLPCGVQPLIRSDDESIGKE